MTALAKNNQTYLNKAIPSRIGMDASIAADSKDHPQCGCIAAGAMVSLIAQGFIRVGDLPKNWG